MFKEAIGKLKLSTIKLELMIFKLRKIKVSVIEFTTNQEALFIHQCIHMEKIK